MAGADGQYTAPPGNPFVSDPQARPEVWTYGFRNPFRMSFDHATGDLAIGDVGLDTEEEIDFASPGDTAGGNFGWEPCEGGLASPPTTPPAACPLAPPSYRPPALTLSHYKGPGDLCSGAIVGGYVCATCDWAPWTDSTSSATTVISSSNSTTLTARGASAPVDTGLAPNPRAGVVSFGEDADCRLYVISQFGSVWRIDPAAGVASGPVGCQSVTKPGQPGAGGPTAQQARIDGQAPVLSRLSILPARFRVARALTAISALVRGTRLQFQPVGTREPADYDRAPGFGPAE